MKQLVLGSLVVVMAACACPERSRGANSATAQQEAPKALETTVRLQSPVRVSWEEVSLTGTQAVVRAKIERLNRLDMPFALSVELPAGVKVLEGRTQLTLLPNTEAVTITEQLTLSFQAPPEGDAVLKLDGDSGAMGFHSKVPYRFGRAAPEERGPAATGPAPGKGEKTFGPSVPLK